MTKAGASVAVDHVVDPEDADRVVEEIRNVGGEATAIEADVSNELQVRAMFQTSSFENCAKKGQ